MKNKTIDGHDGTDHDNCKINFQLIKQWQTDLSHFFVIKQLDILVPK